MQTLTTPECLEWLRSHHVPVLGDRRPYSVPGDYEILFERPREARAQGILARALVQWLAPFESALFWLTDWPFYQADEMALIVGLRQSHGDQRRLIDSPGHVFECVERDELTGWVSLMMSFGWDGHLFVSPFRGDVFHTSHHDDVQVITSHQERFQAVREAVRAFGLSIHRETSVA